MPLQVVIHDQQQNNNAKVSSNGQLVTAPFSYSTTSVQNMLTPDIAYNLVKPIVGCDVVITGFIMSADKDVSNVADATIFIYEADSVESTDLVADSTGDIELGLSRFQQLPLTGLNIKARSGRWINAKTDDAGVKITLFYYYIPEDGL